MHQNLPPRLRIIYAELDTQRPRCWLSSLSVLGLRQAGRIATGDRTTVILERSKLRLLVSSMRPGSAPAGQQRVPSDRITDLAIAVVDVPGTVARAADIGMSPIEKPRSVRAFTGDYPDHAVIRGSGALRHSLFEVGSMAHRTPASGAAAAVDHVTFVVPQHHLELTAAAYAHVFGLHPVMLPFIGACGEVAGAWYLQSADVTFTFVAPAPNATGHLAAFLAAGGTGIHHLGLQTGGRGIADRPETVTAPAADADPCFGLELLPRIDTSRSVAGDERCRLLPLATFSTNETN